MTTRKSKTRVVGFQNFICTHTGDPVEPAACIAHAQDNPAETLRLDCHWTANTLRACLDSLTPTPGETFDARTFRVTETVGCLRAARLKRAHPYNLAPAAAYPLARGHLFHTWMEQYHDPALVVLAEQRLSTPIGDITLSGKPDLVTDHAAPRLVDYKSTDRAPKAPKAEHVAQLNAYRWLLAANGVGISDTAELVYLTMREPIRVAVPLDPVEATAADLTAKAAVLSADELPPVVDTWECKYCPVSKICAKLNQ